MGMTFILILTFYAGAISKGDSVSMISQEFNSQKSCEIAGESARSNFETPFKTVKYLCVEK